MIVPGALPATFSCRTSPRRNPRFCSSDSASPIERPTSWGAWALGGTLTTTFTPDPAARAAPGRAFCAITAPHGWRAVSRSSTAPKVSPAAARSRRASSGRRPLRSGIRTAGAAAAAPAVATGAAGGGRYSARGRTTTSKRSVSASSPTATKRSFRFSGAGRYVDSRRAPCRQEARAGTIARALSTAASSIGGGVGPCAGPRVVSRTPGAL